MLELHLRDGFGEHGRSLNWSWPPSLHLMVRSGNSAALCFGHTYYQKYYASQLPNIPATDFMIPLILLVDSGFPAFILLSSTMTRSFSFLTASSSPDRRCASNLKAASWDVLAYSASCRTCMVDWRFKQHCWTWNPETVPHGPPSSLRFMPAMCSKLILPLPCKDCTKTVGNLFIFRGFFSPISNKLHLEYDSS